MLHTKTVNQGGCCLKPRKWLPMGGNSSGRHPTIEVLHAAKTRRASRGSGKAVHPERRSHPLLYNPAMAHWQVAEDDSDCPGKSALPLPCSGGCSDTHIVMCMYFILVVPYSEHPFSLWVIEKTGCATPITRPTAQPTFSNPEIQTALSVFFVHHWGGTLRPPCASTSQVRKVTVRPDPGA